MKLSGGELFTISLQAFLKVIFDAVLYVCGELRGGNYSGSAWALSVMTVFTEPIMRRTDTYVARG